MCRFRRCNSFLLILESDIAIIGLGVKTLLSNSRFRFRIIGTGVTLCHKNSQLNTERKIKIEALASIKLLAALYIWIIVGMIENRLVTLVWQ